MSANVETMFSVRETPWHGLGRIVMDAPASREALELAGLDWQAMILTEFLLAPTVPSEPRPQKIQLVVPSGAVSGFSVISRDR